MCQINISSLNLPSCLLELSKSISKHTCSINTIAAGNAALMIIHLHPEPGHFWISRHFTWSIVKDNRWCSNTGHAQTQQWGQTLPKADIPELVCSLWDFSRTEGHSLLSVFPVHRTTFSISIGWCSPFASIIHSWSKFLRIWKSYAPTIFNTDPVFIKSEGFPVFYWRWRWEMGHLVRHSYSFVIWVNVLFFFFLLKVSWNIRYSSDVICHGHCVSIKSISFSLSPQDSYSAIGGCYSISFSYFFPR